MDSMLKDWIQAVSWAVISVGGIIAAFKAIAEMRLNREQQQRELLWRQSLSWKEIFSAIRNDPAVTSAMIMLDWSRRQFEIVPGVKQEIDQDEVWRALRTDDLKFSQKEAFIRDCFDRFFDALSPIHRYLEIKLVNLSEVDLMLGYQLQALTRKKGVVENYLDVYGYRATKKLFEYFPCWNEAGELG